MLLRLIINLTETDFIWECMIKNIKAIKSTVLGLALIVFAGYLLFKGITTDYWILGSMSFIGLCLFFTGDAFIEKLEKAVFGKIFLKDNDENQKPDA